MNSNQVGNSGWGNTQWANAGWGEETSVKEDHQGQIEPASSQPVVSVIKTDKEDNFGSEGWADVAQKSSLVAEQPSAVAPWGAVMPQKSMLQVDAPTLLAHSNAFMKAEMKNGVLSLDMAEKDFQMVQKNLDTMHTNLQINLGSISHIITSFQKEVERANRKIGDYCSSVIDKGMRGDPSITPAEIAKANSIVSFVGSGVKVMSDNSTLVLDLADRGMSIFTKQTQAAIGVIFDARTKQVQLLSSKIDVLFKQEDHQLKVILDIQEAKLKEQLQLFNQFKEIVEIEEGKKEKSFERNLKMDKAQLERAIQVRSLQLQDEQQQNEMELKRAAQDNKYTLDQKQLEIQKALEESRISVGRELGLTKEQNERDVGLAGVGAQRDIGLAQASAQQTVGLAQAQAKRDVGVVKAQTQAQAQMHAADKQAESQNIATVVGAFKPPCVIQ